jgi:hypothetical protein
MEIVAATRKGCIVDGCSTKIPYKTLIVYATNTKACRSFNNNGQENKWRHRMEESAFTINID